MAMTWHAPLQRKAGEAVKNFSVMFNVQADTIEDATKQARAYVQRPSYAPLGIARGQPELHVIEASSHTTLAPLPHLTMRPCKTCGAKLIDDGWVQFCNEECAERDDDDVDADDAD